jgi:hypothetical protein
MELAALSGGQVYQPFDSRHIHVPAIFLQHAAGKLMPLGMLSRRKARQTRDDRARPGLQN